MFANLLLGNNNLPVVGSTPAYSPHRRPSEMDIAMPGDELTMNEIMDSEDVQAIIGDAYSYALAGTTAEQYGYRFRG